MRGPGFSISILMSWIWLVSVPRADATLERSSQADQPNIIFILADDYGYNDIGYHGSEIETPTLDTLAESGVRLENYYVQPLCTPTRSQLMSGRYQIHTGLQHFVLTNAQPNGLPLENPTLADKLKGAGYSTHMVGKWHLGFFQEAYLPWKRGFDTFFGYLTGSEDYYTHATNYESTPYLDYRDQNGPLWSKNGTYSTFTLTDQAIKVIKGHRKVKNPLFLYVAYQSVHSPLQVPDKYVQKYHHIQDENRRIYAGMVSAMDEGIANITVALHETGLWENTILVFSSDNGGEIREGGNNYPLRGWKSSLWEGGIRGVGFVAGGALQAHNVVSTELIHVSDWFPTLIRLGGGNLNDTLPLDGLDQWETISENAPSKRVRLLHNIDPLTPLKGEPMFNDTWDTRVRAAIRLGDYKLITGDPSNGSWIPPPGDQIHVSSESHHPYEEPVKNLWLFNIKEDPTEHDDLSQEEPELVKTMLDLLVLLNQTAVPCRFPPNDPRADPGLHGGVWSPWE